MVVLLEALLVTWLALGSWRLFRLGCVGSLLDFGGFLAACAIGGLGSLAGDAVGLVADNLVLRFAAACLLGMGAFVAARWWFRSRLRRRQRRLAEDPEAKGRLPRWADRAGAGVCIGVYLGAWTVLLLVLLNLLAAGLPPVRRAAAEDSLLLHLALLPEMACPEAAQDRAPTSPTAGPAPVVAPGTAGPDATHRTERLREAMALQRRFAGGLRDTLHEGVDLVAEATGTKRALRYIAAMRALTDLDQAHLAMLVVEFPRLQALLEHRALLAVLEDEATLDQIEAAAGGELAGIYALGENPKLRALLEDPSFRRVVEDFPLLAVQERAESLERDLEPLRCAWERRAGAPVTARPWRDGGSGGVFAWDPDAGTGSVRTRVDLPAPAELRVLILSPVTATVRIGTAEPDPRRGRGVTLARCERPAGRHLLVVRFPLAGLDSRLTHRVLVYRERARAAAER